MPVLYLVLKQAYLLKFLRSVHTYVRKEVIIFKDLVYHLSSRNTDLGL